MEKAVLLIGKYSSPSGIMGVRSDDEKELKSSGLIIIGIMETRLNVEND